MSTSRDPSTQEAPKTPDFSRLVKSYTQEYLSVYLYLDHIKGRTFYDVVIHRKVRDKHTGTSTWKRGANLKPTDLPILIGLLQEVQTYLQAHGINCLTLAGVPVVGP